MPTKNLMWV